MTDCERANLTACSSEGVEYRLYDNVRVFDKDFAELHIGKIAQLWEDKASDTRKVLIRWFLRHKEVKPQADDNPKELFLAFGEGEGVVNENDLDVIVGKCKVVCTSKDPRNNQPSAGDIENSDYYFSHVYDVDLEHTSPVEGVIDKLGLNDILNNQECVITSSKIEGKVIDLQENQTLKEDVKELLAVDNTFSELKKRSRDEESLQNGGNLRQDNDRQLDVKTEKKANAFSKDTQKLEDMDGMNLADTDLGDEQCSRQFSKAKERVRPDNSLNVEKVEAETGQKVDSAKEGRSNIVKKMKMATCEETEKRPMSTAEMVKALEKRKIFKELPWEESLEQGLSYGKVLLLQNFDPLATSADVRDMLKNTFQGLLDARVLPQESICPSGKALAIFETKLMADYALEAMEMKCLVTDSKRPVIATRFKESASQFRFPGHLALEKIKLGRSLSSEEYKKAVSTSHCSQPNTIEFEMAMEWRQLQEITQNCRVELFKKQRKEINDLKSRATSKAPKEKPERP